MRESGPSTSVRDYLSLINPPLVVSAAGEAAAGALTGMTGFDNPRLYAVALGSALLFAAGAVFGHYFDRTADEARQPDRPLPARRLRPETAWSSGWTLLAAGLLVCVPQGGWTAALAACVAILVVLYAAATRAVWGVGLLNLAAARGMNLLLGLSITPFGVARSGYAALALTLYVLGWAILRSSRSPGSPPLAGFLALFHMVAAVSVFLFFSLRYFGDRLFAAPFLAAFVAVTFPRVVTAVLDGRRGPTLEAVQYGVLGLTLLEASFAAAYAGIGVGLAVALGCIPLYLALKRWPVSLAAAPR